MNRQVIFYGIIISFLLFPFIADARLSGLLRFTYNGEDFTGESSTITQSTITQEYKLNYTHFVYDQRLLNYSIGGAFIKEDTKSDGSETDVEGRDYDIRLNFLSASRYPFSLWTFKSTTTSFTPQSVGPSLLTQQTLQSTGVDGGLQLRRLPVIRYSFKQDDRITTGGGTPIDERVRDFLLTSSQTWRESYVHFNYNFKSTLYKLTSAKEDSHDMDLSGETKYSLSDISTLSTNARFHTNTLDDFTEISSYTNLNYIPSDRVRGDTNIGYNHTDQPAGTRDSLSNTINASYKISNALTTTGNNSFIYNTGALGNDISEALSGSLNYAELIAEDLNLSANTTVGLNVYQGTDIDKTTLSSALSSTLIRDFPAIMSHLSTGGSLNYSTSSAGGRSEGYSLNLTGNSTYIKRLSAQSQLIYSRSKTRDDMVDSVAGAVTTDEKLTTDTSLTYFIPFGWRARLDTKVGMSTQSGTTDRRFYYSEGIFSYVLRRNLSMVSNLRYERESLTPYDTTWGSVNFNYRMRQVFVNLKYETWREKMMDTTNKRAVTYLQITRPF